MTRIQALAQLADLLGLAGDDIQPLTANLSTHDLCDHIDAIILEREIAEWQTFAATATLADLGGVA